MKVLHLLSSQVFSGAENVACQIINMFKGSDIEMVYCSPDGSVRDVLSDMGIQFLSLEGLNLKELRRVIMLYSPDIIHAHDAKASIMAALVFKSHKTISHMHVNHKNMRRFGIKPILYLGSALFYRHIFWVSKSAYDNYIFHNLLKRKSSVLYNIIDFNATYRRMEEDKNLYEYDIVYVGRLTYQKNPERLLKIIRKVINKRPGTHVAIVGTGDLYDYIKSQSSDIKDNVDFLGYMSNPLKILSDSKLMIMTSRFEGTPMSALEAMCLGVPIVSTPADGMKEIVIDGKNGFLSASDDQLVEKCLMLLNEPSLRNEMGKRSIEIFQEICSIKNYYQALYGQYSK